MSSFKIFDIAGSGMNAQNLRMNLVASNLANVDAVNDPDKAGRMRIVLEAYLDGKSINQVVAETGPDDPLEVRLVNTR